MSACKTVLSGFPIINNEGLEILNVSDTPRYMKYMDYLIGQVFIKEAVGKGWVTSDLTDPSKYRQIYDKAADLMVDDLGKRIDDGRIKDESLINKLVILHQNFDTFAEYHSKYHAIADIDPELDDEDETDREEQSESSEGEATTEGDVPEDYNSTGNDTDSHELASTSLKTLFRLLPKSKIVSTDPITIQEDVDQDGLPVAADFSSLWNNLALKLAGKKDDADFFGTLSSHNLIKVLPEISHLYTLLNLGGPLSTKQAQQVSEFYKVFSRPIIKLWMTKRNISDNPTKFDTISFFPQLRGNRDKIQKQFVSNFVTENIADELKIHTAKTGDFNELTLVSIPEQGKWDAAQVFNRDISLPETFKSELDFLELLGIKFSGLHLASTTEEKNQFVSFFVKVRDVLHSNVQSRIVNGERLIAPADQLQNRLDNNIPGNYNIIQKAIDLESRYSSVSPTLMTRNAEGEPQSDLSNDNALSVAVYDLNRATSLKELYKRPSFLKAKYSPLFSSSKIIQHLFDKDGNKREGTSVNVINYSGFSLDKNTAKTTRNLDAVEKFTMDLNNMLQYGVTDTLRLETANTFYGIQLVGDEKTRPHYAPDVFKGNFSFPTFRSDMLSYLKAELQRIADYNKSSKSYIPAYGKFSVFSEILSPELQLNLIKDGITSENEQKFYQALENNFNNQLDETRTLLAKRAVADKTLLSEGLKNIPKDDLIRSFLANSFVTNVDFSAVFSGESLYYFKKDVGDMPKRLKALSSTGNLASSIDAINNFWNTNPREQAWKQTYSLSGALGIKNRDNSSNFKTQVVTEDVSRSNAYTEEKLQKAVQSSIKLRDGREASMDEVLESLKEGGKIKITDGQGRITMDFHRELAFRFGFWTPEAEVAYEYEGLMFRKLNNLPFDEEKLNDLAEKIFSNPGKYSIPVLKTTYFGSIENDDVLMDAKTFDKFSLAPLVPSFVHNHPELDMLNKTMIKNQVGYVKYESATKAFVRGVKELDEVGKDADLQTTILLKEQKKTSIKQKTSSPLLTQTNKLFFANLFSNGEAISPRVKDAYEKYVATLSDIQKEQNQDLFHALGFNEDGTFSPEKIAENIQREISRQKLPSTVAKALETTEDADGNVRFKYTPEQSGAYSIINDYVSGVIDKTVRRYKVNSADFVLQTPSSIGTKLKYFEYSENGTKPMEVKITLTKHFLPLLNKLDKDTNAPIGTIERLNKLLKDPIWVKENESALTVTFSRAPVAGQESMGMATVEEFLPPTMGNVLIMPEEFIAKAGVDFDIDVERVVIPQLNENGDYISKDSLKQIEADIKRLEEEYPELKEHSAYEEDEDQDVNDLISSIFKANNKDINYDLAVVDNDDARMQAYNRYFKIKNLKNLSATNRLLENYRNILSLPENFADLVIPNTNANIKDLAARNARDMGRGQFVGEDGTVKLPSLGQVYEYNKQLDITRKFFESKNYLGGYALDNVFQSLATQNNLKINQKYLVRPLKNGGESFHWINPLMFSPEQKAQIISKGKIDMSSRFDIHGKNLIQHFKKETINATVDAAKDPYHAELGIGWETLGVFNFLTNMRVPAEVAYDYINNPLIVKYVALKKQIGKTKALGDILKDRGIGVPIKVKEYIPASQFTGNPVGKKLMSDPKVPGSPKNFYEVEVEKIDAFKSKQLYQYLKKADFENKDVYISPARLKQLKNPANYKSLSPEEIKNIQPDNTAILINFAQMENHAREMGAFRRLFNYDTYKLSSMFEVKNKTRVKNKVLSTGMIDLSSIKQYASHSVISSFVNTKEIANVYEKVFSLTNDPVVEENLSNLYNEYKDGFPVSQSLLRVLPKILVNDFLKAVVDNFGVYKGQKIHDYARALISKKQGKEAPLSIVDRLANFKKQPFYAGLEKEYPIFKQFVADISPNTTSDGAFRTTNEKGNLLLTKAHNIKFLRNTSDAISETEGYISQLEKLISPDFKYGKLSDKGLAQIQEFVKDLLIVGHFQSGLSKTYNGYNDLIPTEFKLSFFPQAVEKFQTLSPNHKEIFFGIPLENYKGTLEYTNGFGENFYQNNPKYFSKKSTISKEDSQRAKGYEFDLRWFEDKKATPKEDTKDPEIDPENSLPYLGQEPPFDPDCS